MRSSIFNPSFMLLSGGIIADTSGQSYIGNEDSTEDPGVNPYGNDIIPVDENKSANIAIEEPAKEPAQTPDTTPAEGAATE